MPKTAMILAAGKGERMRPLTETTPKPLLKVAGKALIEYQIEKLVQAGVEQIVINQGWLGDQLPQTLGNGERYGVSIQYSNEQDYPEPLETAGGIIKALPLLGDEPFIVVNGDVWTDYDYAQLPVQLTGLAHLVLVANPPHNTQGDFAISERGLVINPNSDTPQSCYTFSGMAIYDPAMFAKLPTQRQALAPLLKKAMQTQQVSGEYYPGDWRDIGTPERLQELNNLHKKSR